ncbi:MAG: EAL domain-containing protein [Candidatus Izemoplasmatales bacterium]|jgi:EAL domain-containing protein (putative c-di-GMP-specific phosphodiesterase class I)/GGDEF domain-containing protein
MKNQESKRMNIVSFIVRNYKIIALIAIVLMLPSVYFLVYMTGGITYSFSHTMYIPIVLAGVFFGPEIALLVALAAGILLGPMMPLDTELAIPQLFINWFFRLIIFLVLGFISGFAAKRLRLSSEKIRSLMAYNQETKLPNTNYLSCAKAQLSHESYAVFTLLINNATNIGDVLGMEIYHKLIHQVYDDLQASFPKKSLIIQADTNKIWLAKPYNDLNLDAQLILKAIAYSREINGIPLYVDFSVGAGLVHDGTDCQKLSTYRVSDASARFAQENNLPYVVYDDSLIRKRSEYDLLATFTQALADNETFLVYQPKIDLETLKPIGLEALIRWQHPEKGTIFPDQFVPIVEETKLIHNLTNWVLKRALDKMWEFQRMGITMGISINISAKNLYDPQFYDRTMQVINESNVAKHLLELEITESVLMINPEASKTMLERFVNQGIHIAIDDFGKGYSSLAYLSQFPIDVIKIDKFFMRQIIQNNSAREIVKATIQLAKQLGYKVIAEGIEEEEVMKLMRTYQCDYAQGYYFSKPLNDQKIIEWIHQHT